MEEVKKTLNTEEHPVFTNEAITPFFNLIGGIKDENGTCTYIDHINSENVSEDGHAELSLKILSKSFELGEIKARKTEGHENLISEISRDAKNISFKLGAKHAERHPEIANSKIELNLPKPAVETEHRPSFTKSPLKWIMSFFRPRKEIHRVIEYTTKEKEDILRRKIISKIFHCSNIIAVNSRRGPANKVIVSTSMGTIIQDMAGFTFNKLEGSVGLFTPLSVYPIGILGGMQVYVDPYMRFDDTSVLVYRCEDYKNTNTNINPGLKLIYKEDSIEDIDSDTEKAKIAIVETGFYPENNYFLMKLDFNILDLI